MCCGTVVGNHWPRVTCKKHDAIQSSQSAPKGNSKKKLKSEYSRIHFFHAFFFIESQIYTQHMQYNPISCMVMTFLHHLDWLTDSLQDTPF